MLHLSFVVVDGGHQHAGHRTREHRLGGAPEAGLGLVAQCLEPLALRERLLRGVHLAFLSQFLSLDGVLGYLLVVGVDDSLLLRLELGGDFVHLLASLVLPPYAAVALAHDHV